ncbi:hypothetical protein MMC30_003609 [Trapelia coarctata]|nr:hypothetical protein [Trapelia coarctata]
MEGYLKIAELMGRHEELAVFRRFDSMNFQNLLYLQAELVHLESDYHQISEKGEACTAFPHRSRDWWSLTQPGPDGNREQWDKVLEIREKLTEYSVTSLLLLAFFITSTCSSARLIKHIRKPDEQLHKQVFLSNLPKPNAYDLDFFRDWLQRPNMGNFPLRGLDRHMWSADHEADLIAIQPRQTADPFSMWFINTFIPLFHRTVGYHLKACPNPAKALPADASAEICQYSEKKLFKLLDMLITVVASLLPISSIVILYLVSSMVARLGIVVGFTAVFSLCLTLVTQARRVEIFAATSAFAAVQVVFVSGTGIP